MTALAIADTRPVRHAASWVSVVDHLLRFACGQAELVSAEQRPWTRFGGGEAHQVVLAFSGHEAMTFAVVLAMLLPDAAFAISGKRVAGAGVVSQLIESGPEPKLTMRVELLLVDQEPF